MTVLVVALSLVVALVAIYTSSYGLQKVQEGHVGIFFLGGALVEKLHDPGYHLVFPYWSKFLHVPVSFQTAEIRNVPCGTSSGVMVSFDKVEVVYRLKRSLLLETVRNYTDNLESLWIDDLLRHSFNELCSENSLQQIVIEKFSELDDTLVKSLQVTHEEWAPGIKVISVRTTKPTIPETIRANYEAIENQRTTLLVKEQAQKRILKKAETEGQKMISQAEKEASIAKLSLEQQIAEHKSQAEIAVIDAAMSMDRQKARTDAKFERDLQRAESYGRMLTPQYLKMKRAMAELKDTKMYLGKHVPDKIIEGGNAGAFLQDVCR